MGNWKLDKDKISREAIRRGLTMTQIMKGAKVSPAAWYGSINGTRKTSVGTVGKVAQFLGVEPEVIAENIEPEPEPERKHFK